mmetsp:Transcript_3646/g.7541  ORF Transcript_3646/g.7541 Transcript_3646/m.7541 type:complete len:607 (+) Transcript_3646:173-1993(+)
MSIAEIQTEKPLENALKPSLSVLSKKATGSSIASSLPNSVVNNSEARFWAEKYGLGPVKKIGNANAKYAHPRKAKLHASSAAIVHSVVFGPPAFSHVSPLAVVSGPRVRLYGTTPQSSLHRALQNHSNGSKEMDSIDSDRQVQTGGSLALAAAYRNDGRLLAVGTDNGQVRVADATTRATFCTFQSPSGMSVRTVSWFRDGQRILAAGDDGLARIWFLSDDALSPGNDRVELRGHGDAIRCATLWQASTKTQTKWPHKALAFTGSSDHTVRVWSVTEHLEPGEDRCLAVLSHDAPVEALLLMPSTNQDVPVWVVSAGGTYIKVWNPLTGVCVCKTLSRHRKTITAIVALPRTNEALNTVQVRIMTGGLDALLRIHSWNSSTGAIDHLHGISAPVPITSLAFSEAQNRLALGTVDGSVLVRQKAPSVTNKKRTREPRAGTFAFFSRGMNATPSAGDFVVDTADKRRKLQSFDAKLKKFCYGEALDDALQTRNPVVVAAVLEELGRRQGLTAALSNRDDESLDPILAFTSKYINKQRYTPLLIGVANKLIDLYEGNVGESNDIDDRFLKLKRQISDEVRVQKGLLLLSGELDGLVTSVAMSEDRFSDE